MNKVILIALVGLVALLGYFLLSGPASDTPAETELPEVAFESQEIPELYVTPVFERTVVPKSDAQLVVTVVDAIVLEQNELTQEEAMEACEAVAYDTDYMWQQVVCMFDGQEIYNDIFIAG